MFLDLALFDPLQIDNVSLENHCSSILSNHEKSISKQGLAKRFNEQGVKFISSILTTLIEKQFSKSKLPSPYLEKFTTIRIMDSTEFKLPSCMKKDFPGYQGDGTDAGAQIQLEYDLLNGKIEELSLSHVLHSDLKYAIESIPRIKKGSLIIRDLGYYSIGIYQELTKEGIYFISRIKSQVSIYEKCKGAYKELSYKTIISRLKKSNQPFIDLEVFVGRDKKQPVRLIANLLDKEAQKKRQKRQKKQNGKLSEKNKLASQLNIFVTNIERSKCSCIEIYELYKLRWQIELIFKSWKSILKINQIRKMSTSRMKCYVLCKLLWVVLNWDMYNLLDKELWKKKQIQISQFKFYKNIQKMNQEVREVLLFQRERILKWLKDFFEIQLQYTVKENKRNKQKVEELLKLKLEGKV